MQMGVLINTLGISPGENRGSFHYSQGCTCKNPKELRGDI